MELKKLFTVFICVLVSVTLITQMIGCGTLIYPERRGQISGQIDVGIALLDALWLLAFIIPGVVAFAVDFTTGAIYLPGKRASAETGEMVVIRMNPGELNENTIKEVVMRQTGCREFELSKAEIYPLDRSENIQMKLAEIARSGYRISLQ